MTISPADLDRLEKLEAEATPGPWSFISHIIGGDIRAKQGPIDVCPATAHGTSDGELIAALRNHAPALIAAAREGERMRKLLSFDGCEPDEVLSTMPNKFPDTVVLRRAYYEGRVARLEAAKKLAVVVDGVLNSDVSLRELSVALAAFDRSAK